MAEALLTSRSISKSEDQTDVEAYQYEPLDQVPALEDDRSSRNDIRLLSILPGPVGSVIQLRLRKVSLYKLECQYDAISYMWGKSDNPHPVLVNGKVFYVRQNLWRFLRHCRDTPFKERHHLDLWCDAICINQADDIEKSHQVRRMDIIYRTARSVMIWLGDVSEQVGSSPGDYSDLTWKQNRWFAPRQSTHNNTLIDAETQYALDQTMERILQNPYWRRLWVFQEIRLARTARIVLGTGLLGLEPVIRAITTLTSDFSRCFGLLPFICLAIDANDDGRSLGYYVDQCKSHSCVNPRDHIFALLGLVERGQDFPVSYSSPAGELLLRAVQWCVAQDKSWDEELMFCQYLDKFSTVLSVSPRDILAATRSFDATYTRNFWIAPYNMKMKIPLDSTTNAVAAASKDPLTHKPAVEEIDGHNLCIEWSTDGRQVFLSDALGIYSHTTQAIQGVQRPAKTATIPLLHWPASFTMQEAIEQVASEQGVSHYDDHGYMYYFWNPSYMSCSFLALAEFYSAIRMLRGEDASEN
ncbi:hypothetical protein LTR56_000224 [Elasticomyces elasticus]|nr:hypothetical protein LTR56_000224 [Elasticomyces elasticus]KAK3667210.1 hypothetical protein LTR22_002077 [Elasticomyces elasticus]KAK4932984.1 hypothetical protein LTR49_000943 [Elasticomyces elasticus]KAK5768609.1 hypothetical protein LTS12_001032 [Elasticomyces elasticus]